MMSLLKHNQQYCIFCLGYFLPQQMCFKTQGYKPKKKKVIAKSQGSKVQLKQTLMHLMK